jgi:hypothetical protein
LIGLAAGPYLATKVDGWPPRGGFLRQFYAETRRR